MSCGQLNSLQAGSIKHITSICWLGACPAGGRIGCILSASFRFICAKQGSSMQPSSLNALGPIAALVVLAGGLIAFMTGPAACSMLATAVPCPEVPAVCSSVQAGGGTLGAGRSHVLLTV